MSNTDDLPSMDEGVANENGEANKSHLANLVNFNTVNLNDRLLDRIPEYYCQERSGKSTDLASILPQTTVPRWCTS